MYSRRCLNDRCQDSAPTEDGEVTHLIFVMIRWLITLLVNGWDL
jgi:hypothetical protein